MTTLNFSIPEIAANQAQKHVTANEAFNVIDYALDKTVSDTTLTAPPGSPSEGDKYIVSAPATGDWASQEGKIACYSDATWIFFTPKDGWEFYDINSSTMLRYTGAAWEESIPGDFLTAGANGGGVKMVTLEEHLTSLSGATVSSTIAFPNQSLILSATLRVTAAITGATSFDCGDSGSPTRFGNGISVALNTTNQGTTGPVGNYATTPLLLTAQGGNFTGGNVRVQINYLEFIPPTS